MPVFFAWMGRMLLSVSGEMALKGLVGAGIGLTTYAVEVYAVKPLIYARLSGAGPLVDYVGFLGIDVAITIVLSALAGKGVINSSKSFLTKRLF